MAAFVGEVLRVTSPKGAWTNKFNKENTRDEPFNGGNTVPMMHQVEYFQYTENDLYQAIRLQYGNEAYWMTVFRPREGKTVDDVLSQMNGSNWKSEKYWSYQVDLKMPRFQTGSNIQLKDVMKELGMPTAFDPDLAEFPYFGNQLCYISNMFQRAVIDLDEEGTEAAAVTVVEATAIGIPLEADFHANRPFLYTISEQSTGAIFFIGQYAGPEMASTVVPPFRETEDVYKQVPMIFNLSGQRLGKMQKGINVVGGRKVLR